MNSFEEAADHVLKAARRLAEAAGDPGDARRARAALYEALAAIAGGLQALEEGLAGKESVAAGGAATAAERQPAAAHAPAEGGIKVDLDGLPHAEPKVVGGLSIGGADTSAEAPPEKRAAPAVAPAGKPLRAAGPIVAAIRGMGAVTQAVEDHDLGLEPDPRFSGIAQVLEKLGESAEGEAGAQALIALLGMVEELTALGQNPGWPGDKIEAALAEAIAALEGAGYQVAPHVGDDQAAAAARPAAKGLKTTAVPASAPAGAVMAVVKHGVLAPGGQPLRGPAELLVSDGSGDSVADLLTGLMNTMLSAKDLGRKARSAALKELRHYQTQLGSADEHKKQVILIQADNVLLRRGADHPELKTAEQKLLELLKNRFGAREIHVQVGSKFTDAYSPSRYERHTVKAAAEPGTILKIEQRGFADSRGITIQKCKLKVAGS